MASIGISRALDVAVIHAVLIAFGVFVVVPIQARKESKK